MSEPVAPLTSAQRFRRYLIAGLLIWVPIGVTVFILKFLVELMDRTLLLLPPNSRPEALLGFPIPGLGFVLALIVLLGTGLLVTNLVGRQLVRWWEGLLQRIPVVRSIYSGSKSFAETVLSAKGQAFKQVLLLQYPRQGIWSIGFLSADGLTEVNERLNDDLICVFVPTTPNPTSGFIMMVPRRDVVFLDLTVDEAMKMILTLGVVVPKQPGDLPAPADDGR